MDHQHRAESAPLTSGSASATHAGVGKQSLTAALPVIQAKPTATGQVKTDAALEPSGGGGGGMPLPDHVRTKMERAMGANFAAVRIHEGPEAAALGARALTRGSDIFFAPGEYQPSTPAGQELLGHELTHVVQQTQGRVQAPAQAKGGAINSDPGLEHEADVHGAKAARGEQAGDAGGAAGASGGAIQRKIGEENNVIFGLASRNTHQIDTAIDAGYHTFDGGDTYGTTDVFIEAIGKAIAEKNKTRADFELIYKIDATPPEALADHLNGIANRLGGYIDHVLIHKSEAQAQAQKYQPILNQLKAQNKIHKVGGGDVKAHMANELANHDSFEINADALLVAPDRAKLVEELKKSEKPVFVYNIPNTAKRLLGLGNDARATPEQISAAVMTLRGLLPAAEPILSSGTDQNIRDNLKIDDVGTDYDKGMPSVLAKGEAYSKISEGPQQHHVIVPLDEMPDGVKGKLKTLLNSRTAEQWGAALLFPEEHQNVEARDLELGKYTQEELAGRYGHEGQHYTVSEMIHMLFEVNNCHRVEVYNEIQVLLFY